MSQDDQVKVPKWLVVTFCVISGIAVIGAGTAIIMYASNFDGDVTASHERWGTFGDFFGGTLNPVFSFLSLVAILATLVFQSKELGVASKEMKNSAKALSGQNESLKQQSFENTFFNMISLYQEILESLEFDGGREFKPKSRVGIGWASDQITGMVVHITSTEGEDVSLKEAIKESYGHFKERQNNSFAHYFRNIYRIYKYIDDQEFPEEKKRFYAGILRAQLSQQELVFLLSNGLVDVADKFRPLMEKYSIFDNLDVASIPYSLHDEFKDLYDRRAFGR